MCVQNILVALAHSYGTYFIVFHYTDCDQVVHSTGEHGEICKSGVHYW